MNPSKKQKEVIRLMKQFNSHIVFCKGLKPFCFMTHNLSYKISIPTMFKLEELGYIKSFENKKDRNTFRLTNKK